MIKKLSIEEVKQIQIKILQKFDLYCLQHNIKYSLAYGTLLGSIRHKGYIPWDDDIDIIVSREDYDYIVKNNSIDDQHRFISYEIDSNFPFTFGKIMNTATVLKELAEINYPDLGISIDVFPIDSFPRKLFNRKFKLIKIDILKKIHNIKIICLSSNRSKLKNITLSLLKIVLLPISSKKIILRIIKISRKKCKNCNYYGVGVWGYGEREVFNFDIMSETMTTQFENKQYPITVHYDKVLKQLYGDYMKLPPTNKQISTHNFEAYCINGKQ